jgi:predicted ribosomally synthesized peptide with SipW-like signal peptide
MSRATKKYARMLGVNVGGGLLALAAMGTLVVGSTFALFSASESSAVNTFESGTVTVGLGDDASVVCKMQDLAPGDSSANAALGSKSMDSCSYAVKYTGSSAAWLSVDVLIESTGTSLYTGDAKGLQFFVADGATNIIDGTTFATIDGSDTAATSGVTVEHILLSSTPAVTGDTATFAIDYLLPLLAPNSLQGADTSITITFHAVQSANQPIGSCQAGRQCNTITWG